MNNISLTPQKSENVLTPPIFRRSSPPSDTSSSPPPSDEREEEEAAKHEQWLSFGASAEDGVNILVDNVNSDARSELSSNNSES